MVTLTKGNNYLVCTIYAALLTYCEMKNIDPWDIEKIHDEAIAHRGIMSKYDSVAFRVPDEIKPFINYWDHLMYFTNDIDSKMIEFREAYPYASRYTSNLELVDSYMGAGYFLKRCKEETDQRVSEARKRLTMSEIELADMYGFTHEDLRETYDIFNTVYNRLKLALVGQDLTTQEVLKGIYRSLASSERRKRAFVSIIHLLITQLYVQGIDVHKIPYVKVFELSISKFKQKDRNYTDRYGNLI